LILKLTAKIHLFYCFMLLPLIGIFIFKNLPLKQTEQFSRHYLCIQFKNYVGKSG